MIAGGRLFASARGAAVRALGAHLDRRFGRRPAVDRPARVLVVRLDEIGDVVLTTPLLAGLRDALPAARITVVARRGVADLLAGQRYIDEVLPLPIGEAGGRNNPPGLHLLYQFAARHLRPRRFDWAVAPRWDMDLAGGKVLCFLSGAPRRVGFVTTSRLRPPGRSDDSPLLTDAVVDAGVRHEAERSAVLLRRLGLPAGEPVVALRPTPAADAEAQAVLAAAAGAGPLVGLVPGAGAAFRRWPAERFAAVGRRLRADLGGRLVVVGSKAERALAGRVAAGCGSPVVDLAGRTTLRALAAVLARCDLVVSNDTGPMHVAAAVGAPVVEVSCHPATADPTHANAPERFGPWSAAARVARPTRPTPPCRDCCLARRSPHCILAVSEDEVYDQARRLMASGEKSPHRTAPRHA